MKNILLMILLFTILISCSETNEPVVETEFSISLLKDTTNNSPDEVSLDNLILEEEPLITLDDVISYTWNSHKIEYSDEAKERLKSEEPLYGKYFVVSASNQRMYWGTFTFYISSGRHDNPVIIIASTPGMKESCITNSFIIGRGYPEELQDTSWPDVRTNLIINTVLKKNGKLN